MNDSLAHAKDALGLGKLICDILEQVDLSGTVLSRGKHYPVCSYSSRVGRYFDILIYRDIFNDDYRIEGRNLSNDISKLSSCSMTIVILLHMCI